MLFSNRRNSADHTFFKKSGPVSHCRNTRWRFRHGTGGRNDILQRNRFINIAKQVGPFSRRLKGHGHRALAYRQAFRRPNINCRIVIQIIGNAIKQGLPGDRVIPCHTGHTDRNDGPGLIRQRPDRFRHDST